MCVSLRNSNSALLSLVKLRVLKKYVWQQLDLLYTKITFCHLSNVNLNDMVLFFFLADFQGLKGGRQECPLCLSR